jgi:16S rRNA C967 or C1407 C5-methylase (RsmB/RsmF family)
MCAAPGMKSAFIQELAQNKSQIISSDFSHSRLKSIFDISANRININPICEDATQPAIRDYVKFDKILIDAPCTGSGTFSTNPQAKFLQSQQFLERNVLLQQLLLLRAFDLADQDTDIVYSVCSMYVEEGEFQINNIINNIRILPLPDFLSHSYEISGIFQETGRMSPLIHKTEGFFIAKFRITKIKH